MQMDNKTKKNHSKIIGQRINSALAKANKMQKDLASHLGVRDNTVSYYCSGSRTPNTAQIIEIAKFLNVSTDYLLGLSDIQTSNIDKKEICRRLHIPDEMYDVLRELFLHTSPGAYVEMLEEDYNIDRTDPRYDLIMKFRKEEAEEFLNRNDTVTLQYIVIKELLSESFVLRSIAPTVCYKSIALNKELECSAYEAVYERERKAALEAGDIAYDKFMTNAGGYFVTEEGKALSAKWRKAIEEQEEFANLADAKEWRLQKQLSQFIDRITDKITKDYYFLDGKMYDRKTNEIVDEYPI